MQKPDDFPLATDFNKVSKDASLITGLIFKGKTSPLSHFL